MSKFDKVKFYYKQGLWGDSRVKDAVKAGWITAEQFEEITGYSYNNKE